MKKKMVCSVCKSDNVFADAYAKWDFVNQIWVVDNVFMKNGYCDDCGGETLIKVVEVDE